MQEVVFSMDLGKFLEGNKLLSWSKDPLRMKNRDYVTPEKQGLNERPKIPEVQGESQAGQRPEPPFFPSFIFQNQSASLFQISKRGRRVGQFTSPTRSPYFRFQASQWMAHLSGFLPWTTSYGKVGPVVPNPQEKWVRETSQNTSNRYEEETNNYELYLDPECLLPGLTPPLTSCASHFIWSVPQFFNS